jgi:hypothetical protein
MAMGYMPITRYAGAGKTTNIIKNAIACKNRGTVCKI